ncbi:hypothetical protein BHE74_00019680 [Ensete ventricosum]|nr:hypothetical protein BHE74_00019680 [Ensete ventricosum]
MCRASLCWFRPVCASSPTSQFLRHGAELVGMSDDSGVGSRVLLLEWRSLVGEEVVLLGSAAGSCQEVGSGKSFYSGCCGLFVPDDLTAFMTHHVAAPHALPPYWWGSVRLQVGVAGLTCARSVVRHLVPFVHPVDRSRRFGRVRGLAVRRCDDLAARSDFALSFFPPQADPLEAPVWGAEDEVLRVIVVWGSLKLVLSVGPN